MIPFLFKFWKQILFWLLVIALMTGAKSYYRTLQDLATAKENVRQSQLSNPTFTLTKEELVKLLNERDNRTLKHVDSLFKANKINPKGVLEEHNITNNYYKKDTTVIYWPATNTISPIEIGDRCWGFKGVINNQKLEIKEKYFHAEIDLVDYAKPKKILFIRVGWHKPVLKSFADCGTVSVRSYKRAKE